MGMAYRSSNYQVIGVAGYGAVVGIFIPGRMHIKSGGSYRYYAGHWRFSVIAERANCKERIDHKTDTTSLEGKEQLEVSA